MLRTGNNTPKSTEQKTEMASQNISINSRKYMLLFLNRATMNANKMQDVEGVTGHVTLPLKPFGEALNLNPVSQKYKRDTEPHAKIIR